MAETDDDFKTGSNMTKSPVEKMRVRLAAEGYGPKHDPSDEDTDQLIDDNNGGKCCSCWRGKSLSPCVVLGTVVLLVVIGFALLAILFKIKLDQANSICQSPDCIMTSGAMLSKMDLLLDPCDDFYKYACSAFVSSVNIPPDKLKFGILNGEVASRNTAAVQKLLQNQSSEFKGRNSTAVAKAKQYYTACMNITGREEGGIAPLLKLINEVGSWSVTSDSLSGIWSNSTWSIELALAAANRYAVFPFFTTLVSFDDKNSSRNIVVMDQKGLTFADYQSYTGNASEKFHRAYVEYFVTIAKLLGRTEDSQVLAEDLWMFEKAIAEAFVKPEDREDPRSLYHPMTITQLQRYFDGIMDVTKFLRLTYGQNFDSKYGWVNVRVPAYFHRLKSLMHVASRQTMANYVVWMVVESMVPYMPEPFRQALLQLKYAIYGVQSTMPEWELCTTMTDAALGFATGALYVDKYFSESKKKQVEEILDFILASFKNRLAHVAFMDAKTKWRALDKANALVQSVGYPQFVLSPQKLDDYYARLDVTDVNFQNVLSTAKFAVKRNREKLNKKPDRTEWEMTPDEVNAYYEPAENKIVIPAGILQKPIFDSSYPRSLVFGSLGFVLGHEITHGFDNIGRQYDKYGNMVDWWSNSSAQQFMDLSQCLISEYNSFVVAGHHMNGLTTLAENIADNGGLKTSYNAYQNWLEENGFDDDLLPGLNMTRDQQFFLNFAQTWCTYLKPEFAVQLLVTDPHTNGKFRVNGVLQNMAEFSSAFKCSSGARMNPVKKCSVW